MQYVDCMTDLLSWYNLHDNKAFNDNKRGYFVYTKCDANGSIAFCPEFKRLDAEEYAQYKKRFANELKEWKNTNESSIFQRVIDLNHIGDTNRKRKVDCENEEDGPGRKKQRMSDNDEDDDIVINEMNHSGNSLCTYNDFSTPK